MTTIYTIQNQFGDEGYINRIEDGIVYDDINHDYTTFDINYVHAFQVISEIDYNVALALSETIFTDIEMDDELERLYAKQYDELLKMLQKKSIPLVEYLIKNF